MMIINFINYVCKVQSYWAISATFAMQKWIVGHLRKLKLQWDIKADCAQYSFLRIHLVCTSCHTFHRNRVSTIGGLRQNQSSTFYIAKRFIVVRGFSFLLSRSPFQSRCHSQACLIRATATVSHAKSIEKFSAKSAKSSYARGNRQQCNNGITVS